MPEKNQSVAGAGVGVVVVAADAATVAVDDRGIDGALSVGVDGLPKAIVRWL